MSYSKSTIQSTHQALSKEEETYANQDYVSQGEYILSNGMIDNFPNNESCFDHLDFSKLSSASLKNLILLLHQDGLSTREIAYHLLCSQQYIAKITKSDN